MPAPFDPYYKWLGIQPVEQPPNHYRLLGVALFEPDPDVIDAAANQRMTYLRSCASGAHVAESQKLLNEVAAARLCLLTPHARQAYDSKLRGAPLPRRGRWLQIGLAAAGIGVGCVVLFLVFRPRDAATSAAGKDRLAAAGKGDGGTSNRGARVRKSAGEKAGVGPPAGGAVPGEPVASDSSGIPPKLITNSLGMKLVLIPAGEFQMGAPEGQPESEPDERPQHLVRITQAFYLGMHEVTQREYQILEGATPSAFPASNHPVNNVTWDDADGFCRRLGLKEGRTYRLPSEAEWEYACRGGTTSRWYFGDTSRALDQHAWSGSNSGGSVHAVGQLAANPFGLFDMYGNVMEWCHDWYSNTYYRSSPPDDPRGPADSAVRQEGVTKVTRGGASNNLDSSCRSAFRGAASRSVRHQTVGFRVLLELPQQANNARDAGPKQSSTNTGTTTPSNPIVAASAQAPPVVVINPDLAPAKPASPVATVTPAAPVLGWIPLFNGSSLDGWTAPQNPNAWSVSGKSITCSGGSSSDLWWTDREFADFILKLDFKLSPGANSGVFFRSPQTTLPRDRMEVQLADDYGESQRAVLPVQRTGAIHAVVPARLRATRRAGQWNSMEIRAEGRKIRVRLNEKIVVDSNFDDFINQFPDRPALARSSGYIGLQSHSGRAEFRNLQVQVLDKQP